MKVGDVILDEFEVLKEYVLNDVNMHAYLMQSRKTNLTVIKVIPNDKNFNEATFDIAFRTPPTDSTGTQHIIEHSVLSGSKYFNVKEPFQILLQSSLQTYLNAGTYNEHTVYPVSSRNEKDFYNLMQVYLDSVFHPMLYEDERIFLQEGHHLRITDGKMEHVGVVLNEMRGVYSDRDSVAFLAMQQKLFQKGCMHESSGGIPDQIIKLTYENFKKYHTEYYTTDNATVVILSHFDVEKELKYIQKFTENASRGKKIVYEKETEKNNVVFEKKIGVDVSDAELNYYGSAFWLYDQDTVEIEEILLHGIIDELVHDAPDSPFKKIFKGTFKSSYDSSELQPHIFLINIGGTDTFDEYQQKIKDIYAKIASDDDNYLTKELIQAQICKRRLKLRTIKNDHGITVANNIFKGVIYGNEVDHHFNYDKVYESLLTSPDIVKKTKNIIKKCYSQNVSLRLIPEVGYAEKQIQEEQSQLQALYDKMSEKERQEIIDKDKYVQSRQETEDAPEMIQRFTQLTPQDIHNIGDETRNLKGKSEFWGATNVFRYDVDGNGIVQICLSYDLTEGLKLDDVANISFISHVLTKVPTDRFSDVSQLKIALDTYTTKLVSSILALENPQNPSQVRIVLHVGTTCLLENKGIVMEILKDIITTSSKHLTEELIHQLREEYIQDKKSWLIQNGNQIASFRVLSGISGSSFINDYISGVKSLQLLAEKPLEKIKMALENLKEPFCVSFGGLKEQQDQLLEEYKKVFAVSNTPKKHGDQCFLNLQLHQQKSISAPLNVNYVSMGGVFKQKITGPLLIAQHILRCSYLWDKIRVMGGAYGCIVQITLGGKLTITTYRDPRLKGSIDDIKGVGAHFKATDLSENQLWGIKVGTLGKAQISIAPEFRFSQAVIYHLQQYDVEAYANAVDNIANASIDDVKALSGFFDDILSRDAVVVGKADDVKAFTVECEGF